MFVSSAAEGCMGREVSGKRMLASVRKKATRQATRSGHDSKRQAAARSGSRNGFEELQAGTRERLGSHEEEEGEEVEAPGEGNGTTWASTLWAAVRLAVDSWLYLVSRLCSTSWACSGDGP